MDRKFPPLLAEKRLKDRMKCQVEKVYVEPISPIFCMNWCRERLESGTPTTRIYNDRAQQSASRAVFQVVNGCAAHPSRKLLTLHLKTCSLFIEITNYQTRVGEDTIWYSAEAANKYIKCLQESIQAQRSGSDDVLQATEAGEIFLNYLTTSLVQESQSYIRYTTEDWARLMNDIVERSVFGKTITMPIFMSEKEALAMIKELLKEVLNNLNEIKTEAPKEEPPE